MIRHMNALGRMAIAAVLLTPLPAAAQQQLAPWATDAREALCMLDGLGTLPHNQESNLPGLQRLKDRCQERFGWTDAQAHQAVVVLNATVKMLTARDEAVQAGVSEAVLNELAEGFTTEELATLSPNFDDPMNASAPIAGRVAERLRARGLDGETARKAALATMYGLIAVEVFSDFQADVAGN